MHSAATLSVCESAWLITCIHVHLSWSFNVTVHNKTCSNCRTRLAVTWITCNTVSTTTTASKTISNRGMYEAILCPYLPPMSSYLPYSCTFSTLIQHQSVVSSSGPHNLCLPQFQHCCPSVWNSLPSGIRACSSSHTFQSCLLKTHCFHHSFSSP